MKLAFLLLVAFLLLSVTDGRSIMSATEKFLQGESERKSEIWQPLIGLRGLPSTEDSRGSLTARRNSSNCSLFRQDLVIQILTTYLYVAASWNTQAPGTQAGVSCTKAIDERNVCHLPGFGLWTRTRLTFSAGERSFHCLRAAFFSLFFQTYREHIEVFLKYSLSVGESFINPLLF